MTKIVYDHTAQTYVAVELPSYIVDRHIQEFKELEDYTRNGVTMDFTQFLIWETECDVNPDLVTEISAEQIPEVSAE